MDLPGSACASRFTYISTVFGCHTISSDYQSRTVWTHSTWTYHWAGAGEILTFWHHMKLTIPAELWRHITHISVYLWGILLDGGMTDKETKSPCCLSTFAWTFPATSAAHFLAFAFLATTFGSKECVMTGIEGLMSSGSVTDVTDTLSRMRNTFCWTVRMNI